MAQFDWSQINQWGLKPVAPANGVQISPEEQAALDDYLAQAKKQDPTIMMSGPEPMPFELPAGGDLAKSVATNPDQFAAERARQSHLDQKFGQQVLGVEGSIDNQRNQIDYVKAIQGTPDFTPYAALADKWTGGGNQLSAAAQSIKGMKPEEKASLIAKLEDQITGRKENLARIIGSRGENNKMMDMMGKNQRFDQSQQTNLSKDYINKLESTSKPAFDASTKFQSINSALTPDADGMVSKARVDSVIPMITRMMGEVGPLTEPDKAAFLVRNVDGMLANVNKFLSDNPNAVKIPAQLIQNLQESIDVAREAVLNTANARINAHSENYAAIGLDPQRSEVLKANYLKTVGTGLQKPAAPAEDPAVAAARAKYKAQGVK